MSTKKKHQLSPSEFETWVHASDFFDGHMRCLLPRLFPVQPCVRLNAKIHGFDQNQDASSWVLLQCFWLVLFWRCKCICWHREPRPFVNCLFSWWSTHNLAPDVLIGNLFLASIHIPVGSSLLFSTRTVNAHCNRLARGRVWTAWSFNSWGPQIPETVFHLIYLIHLIHLISLMN